MSYVTVVAVHFSEDKLTTYERDVYFIKADRQIAATFMAASHPCVGNSAIRVHSTMKTEEQVAKSKLAFVAKSSEACPLKIYELDALSINNFSERVSKTKDADALSFVLQSMRT